VTAPPPINVAVQIAYKGPRPWAQDNFFNLFSTAVAIGIGIYRVGDVYYGTAIVAEHVARN
jgi:hypothetical protein